MCFERGPQEETGEGKYFDGSGEASFHPTDEPWSFGMVNAVEDVKIAIEYLINVDYQNVSRRRDIVLHEESPSASWTSLFTSAPSRRPW